MSIGHLKRGKVYRAIELLLSIRDTLRGLTSSSAYLRSRIAGSLGDCYLRLEKLTDAKDEYQSALNARATRLNYSNLAAAMLNLNEKTKAFELSEAAMSCAKTNGRTLAIHLQVLWQNNFRDEAEELIEKHGLFCQADPDCLLAIGQLKYDERDFIAAKGYFDKACAKAPYEAQLHLLSANCLLKRLEETLLDCTPLDGKLSPEMLPDLNECKELIRVALSIVQGNDFPLTLNRALEFRVCASFFEMDFASAEADCSKILETDSENQIALIKLGYLALLERKDSAVAIRYFEKVSPKTIAPMAVVAAEAYINVGDIEKAKAALSTFQSEAKKRKLWYVYAHESIRLASIEGTEEEALARLQANYPLNGDVLYAVAEVYKRQKDTKKTLELLEKAKDATECTLRSSIARLKAQTYFDAQLWRAAADTYEAMPDFEDTNKIGTNI